MDFLSDMNAPAWALPAALAAVAVLVLLLLGLALRASLARRRRRAWCEALTPLLDSAERILSLLTAELAVARGDRLFQPSLDTHDSDSPWAEAELTVESTAAELRRFADPADAPVGSPPPAGPYLAEYLSTALLSVHLSATALAEARRAFLALDADADEFITQPLLATARQVSTELVASRHLATSSLSVLRIIS